jgi:hypothetical protein
MQRALPIGIGHNMGPPWEEAYYLYCWKTAQRKAWKNPDKQVIDRRATRAEALGMSYRAYTLEILERGRYL